MSQAKAGRAQDKLIATMRKDHAANILICPLGWGTGHAARVQLIAYELKKRGHRVILVVPPSLARTTDNDIYNKIISLPSPSVRYSSQLPLPLALLLQLPLFLFTFLSDRCRLPGILRRHSIDLVISDNRFGLWTKKVPCIYITHQLRVMMPRALHFASAPASAIHRAIASCYDQCWVPDMPGEENLSGRLSHMCRKPPRTRYIGILSRFAIIQPPDGSQQPLPSTPYTLALLSGPEPQRSILEDIIMAQHHRLPGQLVIVAGKPEDDDKKGKRDSDSNSGSGDRKVVLRIAWADSRRLKSLVEQASFIICRSGYSTVMDLVSAGRTALLVPTPGQPEQEYLAGYLSPRHGFSMVSQKELAAGVIPVDEKAGTDPPAKERAGELIITEWLAAGNRLLSQALDDILLH